MPSCHLEVQVQAINVSFTVAKMTISGVHILYLIVWSETLKLWNRFNIFHIRCLKLRRSIGKLKSLLIIYLKQRNCPLKTGLWTSTCMRSFYNMYNELSGAILFFFPSRTDVTELVHSHIGKKRSTCTIYIDVLQISCWICQTIFIELR